MAASAWTTEVRSLEELRERARARTEARRSKRGGGEGGDEWGSSGVPEPELGGVTGQVHPSVRGARTLAGLNAPFGGRVAALPALAGGAMEDGEVRRGVAEVAPSAGMGGHESRVARRRREEAVAVASAHPPRPRRPPQQPSQQQLMGGGRGLQQPPSHPSPAIASLRPPTSTPGVMDRGSGGGDTVETLQASRGGSAAAGLVEEVEAAAQPSAHGSGAWQYQGLNEADLAHVRDLSEEALLHNLRNRADAGQAYTFLGNALVAVSSPAAGVTRAGGGGGGGGGAGVTEGDMATLPDMRLYEGKVLGDSDAQYSLGICYKHGDGVDKDEAEAVKWYRKAA
eukprot:COSAG01_NODE_7949_length_2979_cov_8.919792_2_plen_339_part_01